MKKKQLLFAVLSPCIISCSTFRETHYFKDSLEPVANYYRVDVSGYSLFFQFEVCFRYYDRIAIQEYFGEISAARQRAYYAGSCQRRI
jgi:hypothetical protein